MNNDNQETRGTINETRVENLEDAVAQVGMGTYVSALWLIDIAKENAQFFLMLYKQPGENFKLAIKQNGEIRPRLPGGVTFMVVDSCADTKKEEERLRAHALMLPFILGKDREGFTWKMYNLQTDDLASIHDVLNALPFIILTKAKQAS